MGVGLCVVNSHTGNHPEDDFMLLETILRSYSVIRERIPFELEGETFEPERRDSITTQTCELSHEEFNDFLSLYLVPSEYHVILPKFNQTIFMLLLDKLPPNIEQNPMFQHLSRYPASVRVFPDPVLFMVSNDLRSWRAERNFIYTKDDEELTFLPKEPSLRFGPAARIKDRKYKTRGGPSRPPVKRKLAYGSSTSHATRTKTSSSKDDASFLTVFDDDEGLPDVIKFKDANACHLKISAIIPPAWKNHLDNHIDLDLLDLHDQPCYGSPPEKISALSTQAKEHKLSLDRMMLESQKWTGYQQILLTLELKVTTLETKKARLEALEVSIQKEVEELKQDRRELVSKVVPYVAMELVYSDDMRSLVGKLVSFAIMYGRCRAVEQVASMKEPFDLLKVKGYRSSYKKDRTQASNDLAT
nr:hypothetical protein [Tanacetum cinerariifolium]